MKQQLSLDLPVIPGPLFEGAPCPNCGAQISCFCKDTIRGLSFWQPFGTLMFYDKIETRKWSTPYRGLVLICTTKAPLAKQPLEKTRHIMFTQLQQLTIDNKLEWSEKNFPVVPTGELNGFAIGLGRLYDCRKLFKQDKTYFQHNKVEGPLHAHVYTDVRRIQPFPVKGSQGWFKVTPAMKAKIRMLD